MPTCEEYEVQIEQQAHGALPQEENVRLEAHLAECVDCRAFAGLVHRVEGGLIHRAAEAEQAMVWTACEQHVRRQARGMRMLPWTLGVFFFGPAAMLALVMLTGGRHGSTSGWVVLGLWCAIQAWVFATAWGIRRRWLQSYAQAQVVSNGLVALFRQQLEQDRRGFRILAALLEVLGFGGLVSFFAIQHQPQTIEDWAMLAGSPMLIGVGIYIWFWRLPSMERKIRELA
jgi:hypothetical protein